MSRLRQLLDLFAAIDREMTFTIHVSTNEPHLRISRADERARTVIRIRRTQK